MPMKCSYHPAYQIPAPANHPSGAALPTAKAVILKDRLLAEGVLTSADLMQPEIPDSDTLALVHTREYLHKLESSQLSLAELRRIGLPWSENLWLRSRLATGGTLLAARTALENGMAANLAGGSHHAFSDHGEGFCLLNDVAIAIATLRDEHTLERALVVDLDVHQGNGTAAIFEEVNEVYTFSMHGERNYPRAKTRSNLDVPLPDRMDDDGYLDALRWHLPRALEAAEPEIVFYLAGVDVAAGDRYGRLALTDAGICSREREVIVAARERAVPLVIVLAGGYAVTRERTAELHAIVFREAVAQERRRLRPSPSSPSAC
jgi:acetoin utilization deacetylase AcuC-like enzyme